MMSGNKEFVLTTMRKYGRMMAEDLQNKSNELTGTELYEEGAFIPSFTEACNKMNMLNRKVGFVCKSTAGRVVKLLQLYDSSIYTQEPEELPAQWGFVWSHNPNKALPFIALSTSPYDIDDCCIDNEKVYKSKIDNNVWAPHDAPNMWEEIL